MRLYEIDSEPGTYVSVRFTKDTNKKLREFALSLGLKPIDKFHITVVYSPKPLGVEFGESRFNGSAKITGIDYLGDIDSEYRAVVLHVDSKEVQNLYDTYEVIHGYKHTYDEFIQHVSLAYRPPEDLDLSQVDLPDFEIEFSYVKIEALKE
jgi:hypothetical protein